jgi:hypothetical protein
MKKIMESFIKENKSKSNNSKQKYGKGAINDTKSKFKSNKRVDITCLKCKNKTDQGTLNLDYHVYNEEDFYDCPYSNDILYNENNNDILDLPNKCCSFKNSDQTIPLVQELQLLEQNINNLNFLSSQAPQIKNLYSNETISFKYNYLLNKFI